jgi:tRNA (guanosine-2'-O-)-methyltransferase
MRDRWKRWRDYLGGLEEAARTCGRQVADVEAQLAADHEKDLWPSSQREAIGPELVRRALDIPFLHDLVQAAWAVGPEARLAPPDVTFMPWQGDEQEMSLRTADRYPLPPIRPQSGKPVVEHDEASESGPHERSPVEPGEPETTLPAGPPPATTQLDEASASLEPPARLRAAERALAHRTRSLTIVLERPLNPDNVSAIFRTADFFGLQEVHIVQPEGRARIRPTIARASHRYLDLLWYRDSGAALASLRKRGYRVLAADHGPEAGSLEEVALGPKVAVVLGSEQYGVSRAVREQADGLFSIPDVGFTSYLNLSTAAGILISALDRRMRDEGHRAPLDESDIRVVRRAWYVALARGDAGRLRAYEAWLADPPGPAPLCRPFPSREKAADNESRPALRRSPWED